MFAKTLRFLLSVAGLALLVPLVSLHAFTLGRHVTATGLLLYAAALAILLPAAAWLGTLHSFRRGTEDVPPPPSPPRRRLARLRSLFPADAFPFLLCGILLFGSIATAWQTHTNSFFQIGWSLPPRGGPLAAILNPAIFLPVLAALFAFVFAWRGKRGIPRLGTLFLFALLLSVSATLFRFTHQTGGLALYNDDHASFLFRFLECAAIFPHFESYVPFWNGGVENSVIVTSGIRGLWLPFLPVWQLFGPLHAQMPVYGTLFFILVPATTWLAGSRAGLDGTGATLFAGLVLWGSLTFFGWTFTTGTAGATATAMWLPSSLAASIALVSRDRVSPSTLALWAVTAFLVAQWPPMAAFLLVEAVFILWHLPKLAPRDRVSILAAAALLLLLLLPTVHAVLQAKSVLAYTFASPPPRAASAVPSASAPSLWAKAWKNFLFITRNFATSASPVLVFCGLPGLFAATPRKARSLFLATTLAGIACYSVVYAVKGNLQTYRFVIPTFLALAFPAAHFARAALRLPEESPYPSRTRLAARAVLAGLVAALFLGAAIEGPAIVARAVRKGLGARDDALRAAERLRAIVPEGGRILFAGKVGHDFGGGHLAPFPWLAGREMFAADYYGFPAGTAPNDWPPKERRLPGKNGDHRYMLLHGITHCVTHDAKKLASFRSRPGQFREVETLKIAACPDEVVFEVLGSVGGPLAKGRGTVKATFNRLDVVPEEGETELVLRYAWNERLSVPAPARISPCPQENGENFILLESNGLAAVPIRYRPRS